MGKVGEVMIGLLSDDLVVVHLLSLLCVNKMQKINLLKTLHVLGDNVLIYLKTTNTQNGTRTTQYRNFFFFFVT